MSTLCDGLLVAGWWLLVAGSCLVYVYLMSWAWLGQWALWWSHVSCMSALCDGLVTALSHANPSGCRRPFPMRVWDVGHVHVTWEQITTKKASAHKCNTQTNKETTTHKYNTHKQTKRQRKKQQQQRDKETKKQTNNWSSLFFLYFYVCQYSVDLGRTSGSKRDR